MKIQLHAQDLISIGDLNPQEIRVLLDRSIELKTHEKGVQGHPFSGKIIALLFEKPSLRTRIAFEVAMHRIGGYSIYLGQQEAALGIREPIRDLGLGLSRWVDAIVCRTFGNSGLEELANASTVPVINALSDAEHPCQALTDLLTILEHLGRLEGVRIAFVGDGNNVASSLALGAASVGAHLNIASPRGYELPSRIVSASKKLGETTGSKITLMQNPEEAVNGAEVVYTDVWTSMGQEVDQNARRLAFTGYQVNAALLEKAANNVIFMHDMPAHYGEEVPAGFLEEPHSVAYDQAENKPYVVQAVLEALLTPF
jgi:ornithine carbamoyltransferase